MDPSELVKQPQDVTENPYRCSAKDKTDKQKTGFSTTEEEVQRECVCLYVCLCVCVYVHVLVLRAGFIEHVTYVERTQSRCATECVFVLATPAALVRRRFTGKTRR